MLIVKELRCTTLSEDEKFPLEIYNIHGMNPLHCAAYYGHLDIVRYLTENGLVPVNAPSQSPFGTHATALHYAVAANSKEVVRYLLKNEGNPLIQDYRGYTALSLARLHQHKRITSMLQEYLKESNKKYFESSELSANSFQIQSPLFNSQYSSAGSWNEFKREQMRTFDGLLKKSSSLA